MIQDSNTLSPYWVRVPNVLLLGVAITALLVVATHWPGVQERAWQVCSKPEMEPDWMDTTYSLLRTLLGVSLLAGLAAIAQLIRSPRKRTLSTWVILAGDVLTLLTLSGILWYFFEHWRTYV